MPTTPPPTPKTHIKITFLAYALPHITPQEFAKRWTHHGVETARILRKHGCLEYTQSHVSREGSEVLRGMVSGNARGALDGWEGEGRGKGGLVCDGVATMIFRDWESARAFLEDEENKILAKTDTPGFTDYAKRKMIVGNEILFLREEA